MAHRTRSSHSTTSSSLSSASSGIGLQPMQNSGVATTPPPTTPPPIPPSHTTQPVTATATAILPQQNTGTGNIHANNNNPGVGPSSTSPAASTNSPATQNIQHGPSHGPMAPKTKQRKQSRYSRYFDDWWAWEILAGLLGTLCLLNITIVLAVFDGRPQPEMRWGITLNAVIALITTIMKGALLTPLLEGMSQFKWIALMGRERPLMDFNVYDGASRGGLNALTLFWRLRKRFWREATALAAIFYFLSFGVDTFVQQLIQTKFKDHVVSKSNATLLRSQRYDSYNQLADHQASIVPEGPDADMTGAIYTSLYATSLPDQDLFTCPSSNCTYPITPSLAVCGACHDLSSEVIEYEDYGVSLYRLPRGPEVGILVAMNVTATNDSSQTISFTNLGPIIASFAYVNTTYTLNDTPQAGECALYLCAQEFEAEVRQGRLTQTVVRSWTKTVPKPITYNQTVADRAGTGNWSYYDDIRVDTEGMQGKSAGLDFNVSIKAFLAMQKIMVPLLQGDITTGEHGYSFGQVFSSDVMQRLYSTSNMTALVDRIASSMTSSIRRNPAPLAMVDYNNPYTPVPTYPIPIYPGESLRELPFVHIVWPWIILPAITVLFSNAFLVYAMIRTRQVRKNLDVGVWKSSCLPVLYHGLDPDALMRAGMDPTLSTSIAYMEENANQLKVKLDLVKNEIKLS